MSFCRSVGYNFAWDNEEVGTFLIGLEIHESIKQVVREIIFDS